VAVPEATMHENNVPPFGEHDVGLTWKHFAMQSEAKSKSMKCRPNDDLGAGVA
jgi:hypothetical protein